MKPPEFPRNFKKYAVVALGTFATSVGGVTVVDALNRPTTSGPEYNEYAAGRLDNSIKTNGTDIVVRRAVVGGSNQYTQDALLTVGGVRARSEHSTTSSPIGLAPEGAVFKKVILVDNMIGAKCDLPIKIEYDLLPRGEKGEAIVPEVCWMSADYFNSKDIPPRS